MKILIFFILLSNVNMLNIPQSFFHNHPELAINTIDYLTTKLPMIDTFGHKNLEFNQKAIPLILKSNTIPMPIKVKSVTGLVMFSQNGDNFGSWVLSNYLSIITYLTNCL